MRFAPIAKAFLSDYHEEFQPDPDDVSRPRISTLHSFACRLIRNRGFSIGYDGPLFFASLAESGDIASQVFLEDLCPSVQAFGPRTEPQLGRLLQEAKKAWRDNIDPQTLLDPIPKVIDTGLRLARAYRLVDWDQAIPIAHQLFLDPRNRQEWLTQLQHYLVDEYQDFNKAEQQFISSLASTVASMVVVGDDNQSIFGSRGGSPQGMRQLFQLPDYDQVSLLRCRRCKSSILEAANRFLLWMCPGAQPMLPHYDGGNVSCNNFKSAKAEIAFLVDYLAGKLGELPENPLSKDGVVCLFPSRKALAFYFERIQATVASYTAKADLHPTRQQLALLMELACNPNQRFIERLILESFTAIKPRHKKEVVRLILQHDISPSEAIESLIATSVLSASAAEDGRAFVDLCRALSSEDPKLIVEGIAQHLGRDLEDLQHLIIPSLNQLGVSEQDDLINAICDLVLPETVPPPENRHAVSFLTMHGSKGLTKKTVVLPGLEDAWLPGDSSDENLEEKKRLFYVAITRATDHVLITYPRTRAPGDPLNFPVAGRGEVSRFVGKAGILNVRDT